MTRTQLLIGEARLTMRRSFLQTLFPLIVCGVSLLYLCVQLIIRARQSSYYHAYTAIDHFPHVWDIRVPGANGPSPYLDESDSEDEFDRSNRLTLRRTITHESVRNVTKPKAELWVVLAEEAAVLGELGLHVALLVQVVVPQAVVPYGFQLWLPLGLLTNPVPIGAGSSTLSPGSKPCYRRFRAGKRTLLDSLDF